MEAKVIWHIMNLYLRVNQENIQPLLEQGKKPKQKTVLIQNEVSLQISYIQLNYQRYLLTTKKKMKIFVRSVDTMAVMDNFAIISKMTLKINFLLNNSKLLLMKMDKNLALIEQD